MTSRTPRSERCSMAAVDPIGRPAPGRHWWSGEQDLVARVAGLEALPDLAERDLVQHRQQALERGVRRPGVAGVDADAPDEAGLHAHQRAVAEPVPREAPELGGGVAERGAKRRRLEPPLGAAGLDAHPGHRSTTRPSASPPAAAPPRRGSPAPSSPDGPRPATDTPPKNRFIRPQRRIRWASASSAATASSGTPTSTSTPSPPRWPPPRPTA